MKRILLLCLLCTAISGCSDEPEKSEDSLSQGQVKTEMTELQADGSEKVIEPLNIEDEQFVQWKIEKEEELQRLIAHQLQLNEEFVSMSMAKINNEELAVSILLNSEEEFNTEIIQTLVENIVRTHLEQGDVSIKEENITITNNKNVILY